MIYYGSKKEGTFADFSFELRENISLIKALPNLAYVYNFDSAFGQLIYTDSRDFVETRL